MANQKGGVGKTTTAINLAVCVSLAGKRCLLVDIDPQANATSGLGIAVRSRAGAHYALLNPDHASTTLVPTNIDGLDIMPSNPSLLELERELLAAPDRERRLTMALARIKTPYQYVLIDCPPSLGLFPSNAFACCDSVMIPIQCEYYAMEGLAQILAGVEKSKRSNPRLKVQGIVLTMFEPGSQFAQEVADEVRRHFGPLVYNTVIPRDVSLSEAPSHGKSVLQYDPRARGAKGYVDLAREFMARDDARPISEEARINGQNQTR